MRWVKIENEIKQFPNSRQSTKTMTSIFKYLLFYSQKFLGTLNLVQMRKIFLRTFIFFMKAKIVFFFFAQRSFLLKSIRIKEQFTLNTFLVNVTTLYPLKTPEILWFSDVFRWYKMGTLAKNGSIMVDIQKRHKLKTKVQVSTLKTSFLTDKYCIIMFSLITVLENLAYQLILRI